MLLWNKKQNQRHEIFATQTGKITPLEDIPDPIFARKSVGDGVVILPKTGTVVSPVTGKVVAVAPTFHAYCLETADGLEILVHIGINTVELKGRGFVPQVKTGDEVCVGTPLCEVDLELIKHAGYHTHTPILITNTADIREISPQTGTAEAGKTCVIQYVK